MPPIDVATPSAVRRGRLGRLRAEMIARDIGALVLVDPVNLRYATDTRNMQIFSARNPACGEYPYILYADDHRGGGYDGVIAPNMVLSVESFIGAEHGGEGVKLEQQVLITETGHELMSRFPFEERLLGREW